MTVRDKTIDRVLAAAQSRFGLGTIQGPGWLRDRVGLFLDAYVEKTGAFWEEVADRVISDNASMNELAASFRVGETRFYRDPQQFDAVVQHLCNNVMPGGTISALSAGCSTGEEAYTLAVLLAERARKFQILGIDRSAEAIDKAKKGRYPYEAVRDLPKAALQRHFEDDGSGVAVRAALRSNVTFKQRDLVRRVPRGPFHVIFFKNVLLYLAEGTGAQVAMNLANELEEGGILVSAASEAVRLTNVLKPIRLSQGIVAFQARNDDP